MFFFWGGRGGLEAVEALQAAEAASAAAEHARAEEQAKAYREMINERGDKRRQG